MAETDNKQLVRTFVEKLAIQHDLDSALEFVSKDYMLHDPTRPDFRGGIDAFKEMMKECIGGSKDDSFVIDDIIAEGDRVVTRWTASGCQTKDLPGIPNQGKCFKIGGISISRVSDGWIAEEWVEWDTAGFAKQLGAN
jgi:steroid delta-isomerase-like uncharacterized protein